MPTRTAVLGAAIIAAGVPTTFAVVPAGQTWICKSVLMNDQAGLGGLAYVWFSRPGGILGIMAVAQDLATVPFFEWEGWVVGQPGDVLQCFADTTTVHVWVSGTHLLGVG